MLIILLLIVFASAQECPYCEYNACQITSQNLGSCTACNTGALVNVQAGNQFGTNYLQTIGVCQQCPTGCLSCQYGMWSPSMAAPFPTLYCLTCAPSYVSMLNNGGCAACPANCVTCQCDTNNCGQTSCLTCSAGYLLSGSGCSPSTLALQDNGSQTSSQGLTIGLIIWGSVMTIATIVFLVLWQKKKNLTLAPGLLNSEIEVSSIRT